ncbi:Hypothetical protein CAP_3154 [Chondromyces apiculatus DSM 436]|uniref:Uncharacterized protein n=1 Tax=Chondromyces apiculatus DSM 436 TaxID=1192034 RepID=A0A017TAI9_9BACT|nr:Hypothetical protein CAP_3154 [Chondromyces apiculatus DSM 436]
MRGLATGGSTRRDEDQREGDQASLHGPWTSTPSGRRLPSPARHAVARLLSWSLVQARRVAASLGICGLDPCPWRLRVGRRGHAVLW